MGLLDSSRTRCWTNTETSASKATGQAEFPAILFFLEVSCPIVHA